MPRLILGFIGAALMIFSAAPVQAATDEDQVRAVLEGMNSSYNGADFDSFASHLCADMRRADGFEAGWYESRKTDGPTRIVVNSVDVTGDPPSAAVVNVRFEAINQAEAKTLDVDFLREDAQWKACRYNAGSPL